MASYEDNLDDHLAWIDSRMPKDRVFTLVLANVMEYARPLHDRHGFSVFNPSKSAQAVGKWIGDLVESGVPLTNQNIERALEGAGWEIINFLTSYTGEMRPPVKAGEGMRAAHPGSWSDVTRNLANAYRFRVGSRKAHKAIYPAPTETKPKQRF